MQKLYPKYLNYCPAILQYDERFLKYCLNEKILDFVEQLIGHNFALWNSSFFAKPALNGHAPPWHQDGQYWPIRPLETVTVWIAIDASTTENGCLRVIPGSHSEKKLYDHGKNESDKVVLNQELDINLLPKSEPRDIELESGMFSVHDVYLAHGAEPNNSCKRRG